ncbi:MAG: thioredoxin domain-containing protein [Flavobacterium sp.]
MKKSIVIIVILFSTVCNAITWETSFEDAQKKALLSNKFMLVDFWATWCGPCKMMEKNTWNNKEVDLIMENFIPVKMDVDSNWELAKKYNISSIPYMYILDANGKVIHQFSDYHDARALIYEIERFTLSTEFIAFELLNFYKNSNVHSGTRLAQKYFDYSLLVDKKAKKAFTRVAGDYLKAAESKLKKEDDNYQTISQKIDLLELYENLYEYDFEKVNKKLAKLVSKSKINEENQIFYFFLKYGVAKGLNSSDLNEIQQEFANIEGSESFIGKVDFILSKKEG